MIRPAELLDYEDIAAIRDALAFDVSRLDESEYVTKLEGQGFLVPVALSRVAFEEQVQTYIVSETDGVVEGFIRVDDEQEMEPNEVPRWVDPEMEVTYWTMPHASIGKIAVHPQRARRGIAGALLAEAEQRVKTQGISHLFSFIVTCQPPTNYPSIGFHAKNGFQEVASLEPQVAYNMPDYLATLYGKKLT